MSLNINPHVRNVHLPAHVIGIVSLVLAVLSPSWLTVLGFLIFNFWLSGLGMSIGFHRYFTHRAFKTNNFWRQVMLWGGTFAAQGSVVFWVALHRLHHPNSDKEKDIHTPRKGFFHAYMGWIFTLDPTLIPMAKAADVIRDPVCRFTHRNYDYIMWVYWMVMISIAVLLPIATSFILGALIAGMWSIHQEALINSVCHDARFGKAPHKSNDLSRNVHGLHYLTWGQSLHQSHHVRPADANFGDNGKPDLGFRVIRLIRKEEATL